jgi:hypothetical protein
MFDMYHGFHRLNHCHFSRTFSSYPSFQEKGIRFILANDVPPLHSIIDLTNSAANLNLGLHALFHLRFTIFFFFFFYTYIFSLHNEHTGLEYIYIYIYIYI